jgi:serine phosphatase RsbU (regulator of sigma subunit)
MEHAARRFARRILLIHALLLAAVLAVVAVAGRQIYRAARDELIDQAKKRQQLLAAQTARGIENDYASILNDLDVLRSATMASDTTAATRPAVTQSERAEWALSRVLNGARSNGVTQIIDGVMWRQLQGRASLLFSYSRLPSQNTTVPAMGPLTAPRLIGSDDSTLKPETVIRQAGTWLATQSNGAAVGDFQRWGDAFGNLVFVPIRDLGPQPLRPGQGRRPARADFNRDGGPPDERFGADGPPTGAPRRGGPAEEEPGRRDGPPGGGRLMGPTTRPLGFEFPKIERALVAVVPIARVETDFLRPFNNDAATGAWLTDQQWTAMAASRPELVGIDMATLPNPTLEDLAAQSIKSRSPGCEVIGRPFTIGAARFPSSIVAAEPVTVVNKQWELFVSTSLDSVDGSVNRLFRRALGWGAGVSVSIAIILASTSTSLIRGRMRVERLRHQVLNKELAEARRIQLAWLPKSTPSTAVIDVAAINSPASHISGDFYNWFELTDGRLAIAIGDVTGHGMSAAFLMATTQLLVRTTLTRMPDPGACLAEVNRYLCVQAFNGQFVTMLVAVLDPAERKLHVATAGHPSPLLVTDGRTYHPLPIEPQLVLGVDADAEYVTESHDLPPGAGLLLYTDGVVECPAGIGTAHVGQRFGTDRLRVALAGSPAGNGSARSTVDRVVAAVDAFRGPSELDDDLTVVAVQLRHPSTVTSAQPTF